MDQTLAWLLEGDPAIRWQVMADLLGRPAAAVAAERRRIGAEGWGAALMGLQDPAGTWGGGVYTPKWTSTTYTLLLLRRLGLSPTAATTRGVTVLLDRGRWIDGGVSYWKTHGVPEICVNGMILSVGAAFGLDDGRLDDIVSMLLRHQLADGGWNCDRHSDGVHSSFHTTVSVLEALVERARSHPSEAAGLRQRMEGAWEFFGAHRLFRSHRSGEIIDQRWTRFSFPPRWHYDVLRGLDHLASAGAPRDQRFAEGIELVRARRTAAGRWKLQNRHRGLEHFLMEKTADESRWNTLRALRVLKWWDGAG